MGKPFAGISLALYCVPALLSQTPVFRSTTNLQSIAVQVVDGKGNYVPRLTEKDFTLLEDGRPQKIAFFGAEQQPVSLAALLDSSRSMDFGRKLDRARELLAPLIAGHLPTDQIFVMPFTDRIESFQQLTREQRAHPEVIQTMRGGGDRGTALYDALASALCRMRTAENVRQAIVVITDGADQHSRLNLEQVIELARMSNAQIFMIGFFSRSESDVYRRASKTVTLVGEREIDNPMLVFARLAKESGAESFFPSSEKDLKAALDRISEVLEGQYTLAYYPSSTDRFRKIEVRVHRGGVKAIARRGVGSSAGADGPVHFEASSCEVSAKEHPYAWEAMSAREPSGALVYHEDFSDPKSGWPNRHERIPSRPQQSVRNRTAIMDTSGGEYYPGSRYVAGGYQISRNPPADLISTGPIPDGTLVAYGPSWDDVRASVSVQTDWNRTSRPNGRVFSNSEMAPGLVIHLGEEGYYALLLSGGVEEGAATRSLQFALVRRMFSDDGDGRQIELIPWTQVPLQALQTSHDVALEYRAGRITVLVDGQVKANAHDDRLPNGLTGMAVFGKGDATFRDLIVESLP